MQEVQAMIRAAVQKEVGTLRDFLKLQPTPELSYDDNNTVMQEENWYVSDTTLSDTEGTQRSPRQDEPVQVSDTEGTAGQTAVQPQRTRPATRGISQAQHAAIVAEYIRCARPPYEKFAKHLFDTELYRAIGNDGREAVVSTSALFRWIKQAEKAGML